MLNAERRQYILERLQAEGRLVASELSNELKVSEDTIRRDLREMAEAGLLKRVHGGALIAARAVGSFSQREKQATEAKSRIGQVAAQLIRPGQIVILDGGTTAVHVAQQLPPELQATIITNSPPVAMALASHCNLQIIMLGGELDNDSLVTTGAATIEALKMIRADICMLGVCSLHPELGISTTKLEEAYVKRAMIASAAEVVALTSAEKLGTASSYIVGNISELTHLVTEEDIPEEILAPYQGLGITILRG